MTVNSHQMNNQKSQKNEIGDDFSEFWLVNLLMD